MIGFCDQAVRVGFDTGQLAVNVGTKCRRALRVWLNTLPGIHGSHIMPPVQEAALGIREGQLRLSVGIEDIDDILADLAQALAD